MELNRCKLQLLVDWSIHKMISQSVGILSHRFHYRPLGLYLLSRSSVSDTCSAAAQWMVSVGAD